MIQGKSMEKLNRNFYEQDTIEVAKRLLGKTLVRVIDGIELKGIITDVEAYTGVEDKACHAYGGRRTQRTETLWQEAGHAYIYMIYGMYFLLNVVTQPTGIPCAVLIRGIQPIEPLDTMSVLRYQKHYHELTKSQIKNMADGPGKVSRTLNLGKAQNGLDLLGDELYILDAPDIPQEAINVGKRINIDYSEEAKDYPYRFFLK